MTTIEPTVLLQVDASVIMGIFIFMTILGYTGRKYDPNLADSQKKQSSEEGNGSGDGNNDHN